LTALLDDLRSGVEDARTGIEWVASFYEADATILEQCDDSYGYVGGVFGYEARDLFVFYASRCEDKPWLSDLVLRLHREDDYGVRDALIECATEYLPEPVVRDMIERLRESAEQETADYKRRHQLSGVESLARQLQDAPLFEKTRLALRGVLAPADWIDIAKAYLETDDPLSALGWLERIPEEEAFRAFGRDRLLLDVYTRLGRHDEQAEIAWKIFRSHRSVDSLHDLLTVIGEEQKEQVISGEAALILQDERMSYSDAEFLAALGRMDDAETYIRSREDQLEGYSYGSLRRLAEAMEADRRRLTATIIYRKLLDSILARGKSKAYGHGVSYLEELDKMAAAITDWEGITPHASYLAELRREHGRKYGFWSRYEEGS
jgi:hypothetical protein